MPRVSTIQTNFTAGEISPKVRGRVDVARYQNGAQSLENMVVDVYGGASRAPGTQYLAGAIDHAVRGRLTPFVYNRSAAYHLEWGDEQLRFFRAGAGQILVDGAPYEIATPYSAAEVAEIRYAQAGDTMFIAHPTHPIHQLRRVAEDSWTLAPAPFSVVPFAEVGKTFDFGLTLSATTVGTGRTATAGGSAFLAADVGRRITSQSGIAVITAIGSATAATVEITAEFPDASIEARQWVLEDSPQATLTPSAKGTVGKSITLTLSSAGWRSTDVGSYVEINRGLVRITAVSSATVATGVVKADMDSDVAAQASAWTLKSGAWDEINGYPSAVTISQQRLVAAGTRRYPNGVWGSRTGLYYDFTQGDEDADGYFFALDGESNGIDHLASVRALIAMTPGTEWTLVGGVEKPLTPTNVQAKDQSVYGTSAARPVRVGDELLFVQRSGRKVRAMGYRAESDSYVAPNLTTLAEHITESGVVEMAYQQEPASIVWGVRTDGRMIALTIDRDEGVTAWTPHSTDGAYESVSCAPAGAADEVLVLVRREIDGQTRRYVERFSPTYYVHSGISGENPDGAAVWAGLGHLEGKTVVALADGVPQGEFIVVGGEITLPRNARQVQIGLPYLPIIELLPPEIGTPTGTAQSNKMRAHRYSVLVLNTPSAEVNGQHAPFRKFGSDLLDKPPPIFSGWKEVGELGWGQGEMPMRITQPDPLPFHVLAVVRHWTTNE